MPLLRRGNGISWELSSHDPNNATVKKKVLFGSHGDNVGEPRGRLAMVNMAALAPRGFFSQHLHSGMDEVFVIHAGAAKIKVNGEEFDLIAGDLMIVYAGEVHSMLNSSEVEPVNYLVFGIDRGGRTENVSNGY